MADTERSTENRYDRQELIQGWNQEILSKATLVIIGSDILANYIALNASCLGFGNIEIYGTGNAQELKSNFSKDVRTGDYSGGFLYYQAESEDSKAKAAADISRLINPEINIKGISLDLSLAGNWNVIKKPTVIIDATNSPASKLNAANYAMRNNISFISASATEFLAKTGLIKPGRTQDKNYLENMLFAELSGKQGETTSMIISALAVDEARKSLMLLSGEQTLEDIIAYNKKSPARFDLKEELEVGTEKVLKSKHILQIGAGSEGNFTALGFVLRDVGKFTVIDDDTAEMINLNRQPFLYEGVGRPKVDALVEKLSMINPRVEYEPIRKRVGLDFESYFEKNKPDLIVDTVDNNKTRALLNYFSLKYKIPFISGGTRYNSGQAVISIPGTTACLNCKVDIDQMALAAYRPQSCILAPQPSVITSNQVIAGLMVEEAERIISPRIYGPPTNQIIKYVSGETLRLGLLPAQETCDCHYKKNLEGWVEKMKHLYKR